MKIENFCDHYEGLRVSNVRFANKVIGFGSLQKKLLFEFCGKNGRFSKEITSITKQNTNFCRQHLKQNLIRIFYKLVSNVMLMNVKKHT